MNTNELAQKCYDGSKAKGWHDPEMDAKRSKLDMHMLIVTEVAEATEAVRDNKPPVYVIWEGNEVEPDGSINRLNPGNLHAPNNKPIPKYVEYWKESLGLAKPEGEAVELADAMIRIMDLFVMNGWDLEKVILLKLAYNATRSHRHGGKAL